MGSEMVVTGAIVDSWVESARATSNGTRLVLQVAPRGRPKDLVIVEAEPSLVPDRFWLEDLSENLLPWQPGAGRGAVLRTTGTSRPRVCSLLQYPSNPPPFKRGGERRPLRRVVEIRSFDRPVSEPIPSDFSSSRRSVPSIPQAGNVSRISPWIRPSRWKARS